MPAECSDAVVDDYPSDPHALPYSLPEVPQTIPHEALTAACSALGLDATMVQSITIHPEMVEVTVFYRAANGNRVHIPRLGGESPGPYKATLQIPVVPVIAP